MRKLMILLIFAIVLPSISLQAKSKKDRKWLHELGAKYPTGADKYKGKKRELYWGVRYSGYKPKTTMGIVHFSTNILLVSYLDYDNRSARFKIYVNQLLVAIIMSYRSPARYMYDNYVKRRHKAWKVVIKTDSSIRLRYRNRMRIFAIGRFPLRNEPEMYSGNKNKKYLTVVDATEKPYRNFILRYGKIIFGSKVISALYK